MTQYRIKDISVGNFFSQPIYLDEMFILATPETPFAEDLLSSLRQWDFNEVYSAGEPKHESFAQNADIAKAAGELLSGGSQDQDKVTKQADEFYWLFQKYTEDLLSQISENQDLNAEAVTENIKTVYLVMQKHRRLLLLVQQNHEPKEDENYQASHAVKSMILSLMMGFTLKLAEDKMVELGVAALLHEIGMMKLPQRLYLTKWNLTPDERKTILTHPILGYKLLKSFDFPSNICLCALEHHERENSGGYPQKLPAHKISLYSKIIAVACSYEALTSNRPYKKAKDKHAGIMDMLKNEGKQYDDTILRALVSSLSVYPIGLYVLLSNGKKAQVMDVDPENPRFPVVKILGMATKDGKKVIIPTSSQLSIARPLTKEEIY
ncbi:MAG: HD-GYP domain-containing protein [Spirochaetaceae bacterium]|jgi:HD-GYP domain-containing protein (c-di-GMP phosphodiesterase class II)|nr:HD-GYP domain-containing protein [Spirochaetaceae bacterium]